MSDVKSGRFVNIAFKDKNALYMAYMPFLKNGGLFVQTTRKYMLGEELFLMATLPDDTERYGFTGVVVWVNAKPQGTRPQGVGIQFKGEEAQVVHKKIEAMMASTRALERPTYTM